MQTLVVYDIPSDKLRNRIAETCKDYGLERIQWSAFMGELDHYRRGELALKLGRTLGREDGSIHLYPLCEKDMGLRVTIGTLDPYRLRAAKGEEDEGNGGPPGGDAEG